MSSRTIAKEFTFTYHEFENYRIMFSARQKNLKNAFNGGQNVVKFKRVLLVDDIYTTGSTMDECSRALLKAGAESVYGLSMTSGSGV